MTRNLDELIACAGGVTLILALLWFGILAQELPA